MTGRRVDLAAVLRERLAMARTLHAHPELASPEGHARLAEWLALHPADDDAEDGATNDNGTADAPARDGVNDGTP